MAAATVIGIRSLTREMSEAGPYGGYVTAVRMMRRVCMRKYSGKTRFCRVVKADMGSAW